VVYLLLKVVSSVGMGLVLKQADARGVERLPVIRTNYAVAAVLAFFGAVLAGQTHIGPKTTALAGVTGLLFVAGLFCWTATIRAAGLALSVVAMRTAVVIPVLASVLIWRERPTTMQLAGTVVALVAMALVLSEVWRRSAASAPGTPARNAPLWLAGLFLLDGLVMVPAQVFRKELPAAENLPFQAVLFVAAFLVTTIIYYVSRQRMTRQSLNYGAVLGAANLGNYLFLVLALMILPGVVVYPVIAAAEVGLMALAGVLVWKEKVGARSWAGIALAIVALVLIQLGRTG
jgi:drug/metabolite transporter (DMT)-like permease